MKGRCRTLSYELVISLFAFCGSARHARPDADNHLVVLVTAVTGTHVVLDSHVQAIRTTEVPHHGTVCFYGYRCIQPPDLKNRFHIF